MQLRNFTITSILNLWKNLIKRRILISFVSKKLINEISHAGAVRIALSLFQKSIRGSYKTRLFLFGGSGCMFAEIFKKRMV